VDDFNYWIKRKFKADKQDGIEVLGIDETAAATAFTKKGHNYVTVAVDMEQRRVIYATPGKGAGCIEKLLMGRLTLTLPDGEKFVFGNGENELRASMHIKNNIFFKKCMLYGDIGFG
jgi:hypothetical protein